MDKKVSRASHSVSADQARKAVQALLNYVQGKQKKSASQLLEAEEMLYLIVTLKSIPAKQKVNPDKIPIPHTLYPPDSTEVCLIIKDADGEGKLAKEKLEKIPGVAKVIGISKLAKNYKPFEAKRRLCESYDLFLVDDRVMRMLPKLLGKTFFQKKKHPIVVKLAKKNMEAQIRSACDATYLYTSTGTCSSVKVGRTTQPVDEIVANVVAATEGIAARVPKHWDNIQSIFLKTVDSVALPIFTTMPEVPTKIELEPSSTLPSAPPAKKRRVSE
eukprot:jgi/Mesvir1/16921/Mv15782-RA.1